MGARLNGRKERMHKLLKAMAGLGLAASGCLAEAQAATVVPVLDCMVYISNINAVTAYFGYVNTTAGVVDVPFGQNNFFFPAPPFRGQPTTFSPGTHRRAFSFTFPASSSAEWTLDGVVVKAILTDTSIPSCASPTLSAVVVGSGIGTVATAGLSCSRADGQVSAHCSVDMAPRTVVTLTATPEPGSAFAGWGGACTGTDPSCALSMNGAMTVTAHFTSLGKVNHILIDPAIPTTLYSALDGAGVFKKTAGTNWTASNGGLANLDVKALALKDSNTLYAATYGGGMYKSVNAGVDWTACAGQPASLNLLSVALDAAGTLYAGSVAGVYVSGDGCATWSDFNTGLPN
jgi:hypothetical protein